MTSTSDLTIDETKFHPSNISSDSKKLNDQLEYVTVTGPRWHEVGIAKYRQMREAGETPLPKPVYLPDAQDATLPSRESGRDIPLRVYTPKNGQPSKGIFLHFHGGGFVLATHKHSDHNLKMFADCCQLTAISVGYRLAPEYPYPAANHDCFDAALYLADHAERDYGAKFLFMGGESAGGCLATLTAFHLMRYRPEHRLAGLVLPFGEFDLSLGLPSVTSLNRPLVINKEALIRFNDAYIPDMSVEQRRDPSVSPIYENMQALAMSSPYESLPDALFLCGTEDPLLDDTLLMSMKWMIAGGKAVVKIYPGAAHGFTIFPEYKPGEEANALSIQFVNEILAKNV